MSKDGSGVGAIDHKVVAVPAQARCHELIRPTARLPHWWGSDFHLPRGRKEWRWKGVWL